MPVLPDILTPFDPLEATLAGPKEMREGSVAGFAVRSAVDLRYLRGGGSDRLDIVLPSDDGGAVPLGPPLREWLPQAENPFHARLWPTAAGFTVWIDGLGWYQVEPSQGRIVVPADADPVRREERLWGIPTSLCAIARGDQTLHAAAVEMNGRAVVFGAPGRHGKTTLATALYASGFRLLSEDTTCCRPSENLAFPGPALLRIRRDTYERFGASDAIVVGEDADRVHLALATSRRGDADPLPIAALVLLRAGDAIRLDPVAPEAAIRELWALAFKLPTDDDRARCFAHVASLAVGVPVWNLSRPLTYGSLPEVVEAMAGLAQA